MANTSRKVTLTVTDNGTLTELTNKAAGLNAQLAKARKSLSESTNKKLAAARLAPAIDGGETAAYGQARGSMGATGASARDFSNQAQGLGGLVRIYATWAANIFAVSAAFNALREAENTTTMIKSMNQLSAVSGVAMGSLAKQFADASGGAISLREAMEATTKAISSGMSQAQFKQLGEVANKASKALGVNMSDAVSRLTRGITKLEPELIDELGIFAKVGKASEDYAKSVGKSVNSLTDFEKRQAYANAVLEEGARKFGDIDIQANPYDQLAASLKNLSQEVLSGINSVLGPLIRLMSSSPTALGLAVAGLATILLKQAVPAIGQYKQELASAADLSKQRWEAKASEVRKIEEERLSWMKDEAEKAAEAEIAAVDKSVKEIERIRKSNFKSNTKGYEILSKATQDLTEDDLNYLKQLQSRYEKQGKFDLAGKYKSAETALRASIAAEKEYEAVVARVNEQLNKRGSLFSAKGQAERRAEKASNRYTSMRAISTAVEDTQVYGVKESLTRLNKTISDSKLPLLNRMFTLVGGGAAIATTGVTGLLSAMSDTMVWVGVAVGAFSLLNSILSSNSAQQAKFADSITAAKEAADTATAVMDLYGNTLSAESLIAKANAIDGLAVSIDDVTRAAEKSAAAASGFDKFTDWIADFFNSSNKDALAASVSNQVIGALELLDTPEAKKLAEEKIAKLLGIKYVTKDNIQEAIESSKDFIGLSKKLADQVKSQSNAAQATKLSILSVRDALAATKESLQTLKNSLSSNDPLQKYGESLAKQGFTMREAFKDLNAMKGIFTDIAKDSSKLELFPESVRSQIASAAKSYSDTNTKVDEYRIAIANARKELELLESTQGFITSDPWENAKRMKSRQALRDTIGSLESALKPLESRLKSMGTEFGNSATASITAGITLAMSRANAAIKQSNLDATSTAINMLPDSAMKIEVLRKLEIEKISLQRDQILQTNKLIAALELSNALEMQKAAKTALDDAKTAGPNQDIQGLTLKLAEVTKYVEGLKSGNVTAAMSGVIASRVPKEALESMLRESGTVGKLAALAGQEMNANLQAFISTIRRDMAEQVREAQARQEKRNLDFEYTKTTPEYLSATESSRLQMYNDKVLNAPGAQADRRLIDTASQAVEEAILRSIAAGGFRSAPKSVVDYARSSLDESQSILNSAVERSDTTAKAKSAQQGNELRVAMAKEEAAATNSTLEALTVLADIEAGRSARKIEASRVELEFQQQIGALDKDTYTKRSVYLDLEASKQEYVNKQTQAAINLRKTLADLDTKKAEAGGAETLALKEQRQAAIDKYTAEIEGAKGAYENQQKLADMQLEMTERMETYSSSVKQMFSDMGDALVDFVKTGKLDFKSLINSMLEDLVRYEIKRSAMRVFESGGGLTGIASMLGSLLGSSSTPAASTTGTAQTSFSMADYADYSSVQFKTGGAFSGGLQKFAKGGTFTNSVVNSPTLFKFAKGTGLMGEAGPEAIMPLQRDSSGSLGVKATTSSPKVDIVVNNNSGQQAEAKETVDSRGNRRVEITIGEMVASEMARPNSSLQSGMRNTFGTAPRLIRR